MLEMLDCYTGGRNNNYNPLPRSDNRRPDYGRGTPADRPYQARGGQQTPFRPQDRNQGRNYQADRPNNFQPRPNGYQTASYRPYGGGGGNGGPPGQTHRAYEGPRPNPYGYRAAALNPDPAPQRQGNATSSVEELTRQMEHLQISPAQVAREQRRNEQRQMNMNMFAMSLGETHPEPQEEECSYDENHPFAAEEEEDSYPGSADALVDDPTAAQLEVLMQQMQELEIFVDAYAESQQELTGNYNIGPEEDEYEDMTLGQCNYGYEEEQHEDSYPGYVDVHVCTSASGDFFVQALDPSDAMDLDSGHDTTPDEDTSNLPLLCVMDPVSDAVSDAEDDYMWDEDAGEPMYDIPDHQYGMYNMAPAFYSTKRVADNLPPRRAPIKRVAFDPSTFGTSGAAPARNPATAPPRGNPLPQNPRPVPQNPRAVPVPQRNQGPQRPAAPAARTNDPLQPPAPHRGSGQGAGPSQQTAAA